MTSSGSSRSPPSSRSWPIAWPAHGPVWRYASVEEGLRVVVGVLGGASAATCCIAALSRLVHTDLPLYTAPPVAVLLMLMGCGGIRFQSRLFALERQRSRDSDGSRALIVGAGSEGATLAYELSHTDAGREVRVVGFVDDDPLLLGRSVRGLRVLGPTSNLDELCRTHAIDRILIALPQAGRDRTKAIVEQALRTDAQVKVLPLSSERVHGPLLRNVRDLDLTDLLGREHAPVDSIEIGEYLGNATVLITGAGGSIGSEIARQVARYHPRRMLLLDRDESLLHDLVAGPLVGAEPVLADIRDRRRLNDLFERHRPDVVFHAAAHKHVPMLERHPSEAVRTNVLGTWWLAKTAADHGCARFVHISTDKAADPCSVMGATKRAAEQIVFEIGRRFELPFVAVRFGNVLGSRGSVVPTFLRQILEGGPVTVTSPEMTRYFMTIPEAVSLVLQSGAMATDSRIFLLDMGEPVSILALARQMIRLAGLRPDDDIAVSITGTRPGERLHERLHDDAEIIEPAGHPSIAALTPKMTWQWDELLEVVAMLGERAEAGDDGSVTYLLEEMLRRGGIDCRLEHADGRAELAEPIFDSRSIDLGVPSHPAGRRAAVLGGEPAFAPALAFARPARPALDQVVERLRPSYERGMLTNGALVAELEERIAERLGVDHVVAV
ncbi:MAG: nucleoside-diphosphate sugar epimerase/dehydratase, partial [Acidimicrobiales bacterium]